VSRACECRRLLSSRLISGLQQDTPHISEHGRRLINVGLEVRASGDDFLTTSMT